jgi:endonuclease YncB( thermonuclease family)
MAVTVSTVGAVAMVSGGPVQASAAAMYQYSGTATKDVDGDTEYIDIAGDGLGPVSVRNAGIQAMEAGQCHYATAAAEMSSLTTGKTVTLSTPNPALYNDGRPVRTITTGGSDGTVDVQQVMLRNGYALWLNLTGETTNGYEYRLAMEEAMADHLHLWDYDGCGVGPQSDVKPIMWINYDADGDDTSTYNTGFNGEYVRIWNPSSQPLSLSGWWLRNATHDAVITFGDRSIPANGTIIVRVGHGTNTASTVYWNQSTAMFINPTSQTGDIGSGMYLYDPLGNPRAWVDYPCVYQCAVPGLKISKVNYDAPGNDLTNPNGEYISIQTTGGAVNLSRIVMEFSGRLYRFGFGNVLEPGQTMSLHSGKGTNTGLTKYFGSSIPYLANSGGVVRLRTTEDVAIACASYGDEHC